MENKVMDQLLSRRSVRIFEDKPIAPEIIDQIVKAGQHAASSINGQQISLIVITDEEKRKQIGAVSGGTADISKAPLIILVVADFYRVNEAIKLEGKEMGVLDSVEGLVYGTMDAGITVNTLATAAESFGLGTTVIGGLRNDVASVIDIFDLPEYTLPLVGLIVGYPDKAAYPEIKPRIAQNAYAFENTYQIADDYQKVFEDYEVEMDKFRELSGHDSPVYTERVAAIYGRGDNNKRKNSEVYNKQGFKIK